MDMSRVILGENHHQAVVREGLNVGLIRQAVLNYGLHLQLVGASKNVRWSALDNLLGKLLGSGEVERYIRSRICSFELFPNGGKSLCQ